MVTISDLLVALIRIMCTALPSSSAKLVLDGKMIYQYYFQVLKIKNGNAGISLFPKSCFKRITFNKNIVVDLLDVWVAFWLCGSKSAVLV